MPGVAERIRTAMAERIAAGSALRRASRAPTNLRRVAVATYARARARVGLGGMGPFLFAAAAMFTAMYSTQAILPELGATSRWRPRRPG